MKQASSMSDGNSQSAIRERVASGRVTWSGPLMMVFARLGLALILQVVLAVLFTRGSLADAGHWWPVYAILIDLGCLALLLRLTRREGLRLLDLASFDRKRLGRDLLLGFGFAVLFLPLALGGMLGSSLLVNGTAQSAPVYSPLPQWAVVYSLIVFPLVWGIVEQLTYQGYALPRLQALSGGSVPAVCVVVFGWAVQHIALPLIWDPRYMLIRFMSFIPLAILMTVLYLHVRRLLPFIVAHWALDFLGVVSGLLLPMLSR